jgi:hypothetical protein
MAPLVYSLQQKHLASAVNRTRFALAQSLSNCAHPLSPIDRRGTGRTTINLEREKANLVLLDELIRYQEYCHEMDKGRVPDGLREVLNQAAVVSSA